MAQAPVCALTQGTLEPFFTSMTLLGIVLHRSQCAHDINRVCLSSELLELWIIGTHEDIVLLRRFGQVFRVTLANTTYLFISNCEFPLCFLVGLRVLIQFLDCVVVQHRLGEFDVSLSVLMAWKDLGIIWERSQDLESCVHFLWRTLEKAAAAAYEHGIAGKHSPVRAMLKKEADAVLGMAGCM